MMMKVMSRQLMIRQLMIQLEAHRLIVQYIPAAVTHPAAVTPVRGVSERVCQRESGSHCQFEFKEYSWIQNIQIFRQKSETVTLQRHSPTDDLRQEARGSVSRLS